MSSTRIPSSDKVLLRELVVGAQKTFGNAEALFREASPLTKARCFSRALFLHQISLEECAKIEILGAYATGLLMGHHVDLAKVRNALICHARKNRTNAYFLAGLPEEEAAKRSGDVQKAIKSFSEMQERPAGAERAQLCDERRLIAPESHGWARHAPASLCNASS